MRIGRGSLLGHPVGAWRARRVRTRRGRRRIRSSEEFRSGSEAVPKGLAGKDLSAYLYIAERGECRTAEIAEAIGLTPRGTLKVLKRLVERGVVAASGATSNRVYTLS